MNTFMTIGFSCLHAEALCMDNPELRAKLISEKTNFAELVYITDRIKEDTFMMMSEAVKIDENILSYIVRAPGDNVGLKEINKLIAISDEMGGSCLSTVVSRMNF